jgi:rsbT co-antagonist protein RsbR
MISVERQRIDRLLDVLAQAALGNYDARISIVEDAEDDAFLDVEVSTNILIDELLETRRRNGQQLQALDKQGEELRQKQAELVRALSTPIIVVAPGVLALPIIGTVESERAQSMTWALLERVTTERASHVILDLTGAGEIAAATARSLVQMAHAVRLLGSRCILTGISPQMAQTLVSLSFDIAEVQALPQLADALAFVLSEKAKKRNSHADSSGRG